MPSWHFSTSPSAKHGSQHADFIVVLTSHPCDERSLLTSSTGCYALIVPFRARTITLSRRGGKSPRKPTSMVSPQPTRPLSVETLTSRQVRSQRHLGHCYSRRFYLD